MSIIKKIIAWILSLIAKLFGKKKKVIKKEKDNNSSVNNQPSKKKSKDGMVGAMPNTTMPSYMLISDQDRIALVNRIRSMREDLLNDNSIKEKSIEKIVSILKDNVNEECEYSIESIQRYLEDQDFSKLSPRRIHALLEGYDDITKEQVNEIIEESQVASRATIESANNLEEIAQYVENNEISLATEEFIDDEILNKKGNLNKTDESVALYDKDILNIIKQWDDNIVNKTMMEYDTVNYVTLSTVMIDDILAEYDRIMDDYQHRRYNKYYYEEQLGRIKNKIDYLKNIKNSGIVSEEIERLRNELSIKSKDKYDILYNNEIFVDIDKKCDILLEKVNKKVVDSKKQEEVKEKRIEREEEQNENWRSILLRFQDLSLSQKLILFHQKVQLGKIDYNHIDPYIDSIFYDFAMGVEGPFNYERNRTKTELVNLYNDLNIIAARKEKQPYVMVNHINFRMEDLVDAVIVKKHEIEKDIDPRRLKNSSIVDDKLEAINSKYIEKNEEKVFSRGRRAA